MTFGLASLPEASPSSLSIQGVPSTSIAFGRKLVLKL